MRSHQRRRGEDEDEELGKLGGALHARAPPDAAWPLDTKLSKLHRRRQWWRPRTRHRRALLVLALLFALWTLWLARRVRERAILDESALKSDSTLESTGVCEQAAQQPEEQRHDQQPEEQQHDQQPEEQRPSVQGAYDLAKRRVPARDLPLLAFELAAFEDCDTDCFHFARRPGPGGDTKLVVVGSSPSALTYGLATLYRQQCGVTLLSWASRGVEFPSDFACLEKALPRIRPTVHSARVRFRYYLNQVTWSYSMSWWGWERWEQELDWMALHGVNLALAHVGQEALWVRVWRDFLREEFRWWDFFTGAAYLSWHRMGNVQAVGAPLTESWLAKQLALQHRILKRMRTLGIDPVLPAFNLHVPRQLHDQGPGVGPGSRDMGSRDMGSRDMERSSYWSGFRDDTYTALWRLDPTDPRASRIAQRFVHEQLREYGSAVELGGLRERYYSADLFNEMDPGDTDVAAALRAVLDPVLQCDDAAVLVTQMWCFAHGEDVWTLAKVRSFMRAVPSSRVLYLDLHGEKRPQWKRLAPILGDERLVWTYLHNFGGTKGMAGEIELVRRKADQAMASGEVEGLGVSMEGIEQNEVVYDHVFDLAWSLHAHKPSGQWLRRWARARYRLPMRPKEDEDVSVGQGEDGENGEDGEDGEDGEEGEDGEDGAAKVLDAWACALKTVYARPERLTGWGNTKSVVEVRPALWMRHADFQPSDYHYERRDFARCAQLLVDGFWSIHDGHSRRGAVDVQSLAYDTVDFLRQAVSDKALQVTEALDVAFAREQTLQLKALATSMLALVRTLGDLLATHWMWATTMDDVDPAMIDEQQRRDLRALFTVWAPQSDLLHSYASRCSAELVKAVYLPRWTIWTKHLLDSKAWRNAATTRAVDDAYAAVEEAYIIARGNVATETSTDVHVVELFVLADSIFKML